MELINFLLQATLTLVFLLFSFFLLDLIRRQRSFDLKVQRVLSSSRDRLTRPLEAMEAFHAVTQHLAGSLISVAFFVESRAPLQDAALRAALCRVAAAQPMLRMRIRSVGGGDGLDSVLLYFEEMETFSLDLEVLDTDDWRSSMEDDLSKPFNETSGPLWRVKLLKGSVDSCSDGDGGATHRRVILFTFLHSIGDGKSVMALGDRLMDELSGENLDRWRTQFDDQLAPSYVEVLGEKLIGISPLEKMMLHLRLLWRRAFGATPRVATCSFASLTATPEMTPATPIDRRSIIIPIELSAAHLDELLRRCRLHGCKLHGTLQAVVSLAQLAALRRLKAADSTLPDSVEILNSYAESAREFVTPSWPDSILSYCASMRYMSRRLDSNPETLERTFWTFAKSMSDEVHRRKLECPVESSVREAEFVYRIFPRLWLERIGRMTTENFRREDFNVDYFMSNYGKFLDDDSDRRRINEGSGRRRDKDDADYQLFHEADTGKGRANQRHFEDNSTRRRFENDADIQSTVDADKRRRFDISAAYSAPNFWVSDTCFSHVILSVRGRLFWTINFSEGAVSRDQGEIYAECVEEAFRKVSVGGGGLRA